MAESTDRSGRRPPGALPTWSDVAPPAPGFADYLAGGERRAAFLRYLKSDVPADIRDTLIAGLFALLPLPLASGFGGFIGRRIAASVLAGGGPRLKRFETNLKLIRPDIPESDYPRIITRFHDSFGRLFAEMPHMRKLAKTMKVEGQDLMASSPERPLILVGLHTGNWEVAAARAALLGMPLSTIAVPLPRRARRRIVTRYRLDAGLNLIDPSPRGIRDVLSILKSGGRQVIFCDEPGPDGLLRAPFFGRSPDPNANIATATRLARKTGARLVVFHVLRAETGLDMTVRVGPEIVLPEARKGVDPTPGDLLAVNAVIEPIVRANVDQWYWLDTRIR